MPVWHASISNTKGPSALLWPERLWDDATRLAHRILGDVGEGGFMLEIGTRAVHFRRKVNDAESAQVGGAVDVRATPEADERLERVRNWLPVGWTE